ncbi:MAG: hypothetical protein AB8B55_01070 [Mariniblastus sp.]
MTNTNPVRNSKGRVERHSSGVRAALIGCILLLAVAVTGCSLFKLDSKESNADILKQVFSRKSEANKNSDRLGAVVDPNSDDQNVRLAGGLLLGDTDNLAFSPAELTGLLEEMLESDKRNSARNLVAIYPDVVTKILMGADGQSVSWKKLAEISSLFDEQWGGDGSDRWQDFILSIERNPRFIASRQEALKQLENNQPDKVIGMQLSREWGKDRALGKLAVVEAHRLEGIAHLMLENNTKSSQHFSSAIALIQSSHPYQASQIALLVGEAHRHAGELEQWKSSWQTAIDLQSRWLSERELSDPSFWKKAAFLRPVSIKWPNKVIRRLENSLRNQNLKFSSDQTSDDEAVVWATIGIQSLKRHESQNAILAFKKSEALVRSSSLKEELQMQQALAMIDGGQQAPASAILLRLGSKKTLLSDRAKAILATLKLQNGSLAQGMNLLQSAIKSSARWPTAERLRAQADYGLAYLMRGREEQGIGLLNQVYGEFVKHKNFAQASQCLANIATYYDKTEQPTNYKKTMARLKELESL